MKKTILCTAFLLAVLTALPASDGLKRQKYILDPAKVKANAAKVAADLKKVPAEWQKAPVLYYAVEAMSDIKRLPDRYPVDGALAAPLEIVAAKGEFEPASFVVYPQKDVDRFELKVSDLKNSSGNTIPASAVDLKLVKIWYQCGAGWFSFMADPFGRTLTPELLVNDENLIWVDPATKDNYARYSNKDGSTHYEWISADFMVTDYKFSNMVRIAMLKDADTLQPVVLNRNEFKQFMVTVKIPENAPGGLYEGTIDMLADGKKIGTIPLQTGVLNFVLPDARTNYDLNKPYLLCFDGTWDAQKTPRIVRNLVDHNAKTIAGFPLPDPLNEKQFVKDIELAKKYGVSLRPLFGGPRVNQKIWKEPPTPEQLAELERTQGLLHAAAAMTKKYLGHTDVYCYGADEGGYETVKAERRAWRAAHAAGVKVYVSGQHHGRMLYPLDYMRLPRPPSPKRAAMVAKYHEAHPNGMAAWYADPHSGPENPDYFRRIHGLVAYKYNYDVAYNYTWYRNDWNDFAIAYESQYRGIIIVYAISDRVLDTLAWEGVREGIDDIRYATKLKQLAYEAEKSPDADVLHLGRRALAYLAYWDIRENPDTFRAECANYILQLEKALGKEQK